MKRGIIIICLISIFYPVLLQAQGNPFQQEINAFKQSDSLQAPMNHAILFVGSSSFRLWNSMQEDFPGYSIVNRGFGGSSLPDVIRYADDIIFPYNPKQIVIYCGENDLASSDTVTAQMVAGRFKTLYHKIRGRMPRVPLLFVSIKPSPSRERLINKVKEANKAIRKFLKNKPNAFFVDIFYKMTDKKGRINKELFVADNLHMNNQGYKIWQKAITPYLLKD